MKVSEALTKLLLSFKQKVGVFFLGLGDPGSWTERLVNRTIYSTNTDLKVIYLPSYYLIFQSLFSTRRGHMGYNKYYFKLIQDSIP